MRVYAVCYDISDDKQRDEAAKILLRYGNRVQFSVYEIVADSKQDLDNLCQKLRQAVPDEEAKFRFYRLCENCRHDSQDLHGQSLVNMPAVIIL